MLDEVESVVPEGVNTLMYADDVTLFTQHREKASAVELLQTAVDRVAYWSKVKKMQLNTEKSEVTFFSSDSREAMWTPSVTLNGKHMPYNPNQKFLGVYLDRTLCFSHHVEVVTRKASARCNILASLARKTWG